VSAAWLLGVGGVLSFSRWSGWHPLGWLPTFGNRTFFDVMDFVPSNVLLPAGALATSVFVGWRISRAIVQQELKETTPFARQWCIWALRYACPIAIAAVFIAALW
jgi:NSS family neurotransmitter:Na+ symporter